MKDSKIWFTADTHFGSERTLQLSKRPFSSVEEMDKTMMDNWNKVVGPNDYVFHIGDFGNYEMARKLNGHINLLFGNYERNDCIVGNITAKQIMNDYGFFTVSMNDSMLISVPTVDEDGELSIKVQLVHEPSKRKLNGPFCLFGHIHKLGMIKRNALNVGVDCHHFSPIDAETVLFYKTAIEQHYDEEVFSR